MHKGAHYFPGFIRKDRLASTLVFLSFLLITVHFRAITLEAVCCDVTRTYFLSFRLLIELDVLIRVSPFLVSVVVKGPQLLISCPSSIKAAYLSIIFTHFSQGGCIGVFAKSRSTSP